MDVMIKHTLRDVRVQAAIGIVGFLAIAGGSWLLYKNYRVNVNERAQLAFAMRWEQFEKARQENQQQAWDNIEAGFAQAYHEHSSSDLAPFYLVFQAESAAHAGNFAEAIKLLEKAVASMGSSDSLSYLYNIKLNSMRLSADDASTQTEGLAGLRALAEDAQNPHRSFAWYQLWHHAWVQGDVESAQAAYEKLSTVQGQDAQWASLAQAKMKFLA